MATRMQQRRGTAATWTSANPILAAGEIGFEIDTNKFKIGDGSNRWANLTYFTADAAAAIQDLIDGAPGVLDTLNELAAAVNDDPNFFATVATNLSNHEADTTNVHGIANTQNLVTLAGSQTLTNKTLTSPVINTPTGITKSDVGLGNVDNTSDVNKPVSTAQAAADTAVANAAAADATTKANAAQAAAEATASADATTKANAAKSGAEATAAAALSSHESDTSTHGVTGAVVGTTDTQTLSNKTLTSPIINGATVGGNIVPTEDNTYDLGSPTKMWKDIYVGPGSLYVNGQKVLETDNNGDVVVSADLNENLSLRASGTGNLELNPTGTGSVQVKGPLTITAGKNITSSDGNGIAFSVPVNTDSISSKSANTDLTITANGTGKVYLNDNAEVSGNFVVGGNLTVSGTTTTVNSETISLADNIIDLNSNFTTGTPTENAGIRVTRGDEANTQLRWNESSDVWQFTNDGATYDAIVGANSTQTLSNKTLTSPVINTPTGITKSDVGLANVDNTSDANKPVSTATQTALALKAPLASPTFTGTVSGITKSMVGLGNVDNTSDANKPVSTATQTALDLKAPLASPTFTGTVSGITKAMVGLGNVNNTADADKPVSTATQTALDLKAPLASPTFTGTVSGITKSMVGLSNVDNTADTLKPISNATQTALDLKAPLASPALTGTPVAPTAALGTNTTQIATTAFVDAAIEALASRNLVLDGGGV